MKRILVLGLLTVLIIGSGLCIETKLVSAIDCDDNGYGHILDDGSNLIFESSCGTKLDITDDIYNSNLGLTDYLNLYGHVVAIPALGDGFCVADNNLQILNCKVPLYIGRDRFIYQSLKTSAVIEEPMAMSIATIDGQTLLLVKNGKAYSESELTDELIAQKFLTFPERALLWGKYLFIERQDSVEIVCPTECYSLTTQTGGRSISPIHGEFKSLMVQCAIARMNDERIVVDCGGPSPTTQFYNLGLLNFMFHGNQTSIQEYRLKTGFVNQGIKTGAICNDSECFGLYADDQGQVFWVNLKVGIPMINCKGDCV